MALDDPPTPVPSEDSDEPKSRRDWPDKPGSPEWFAVSQERTDACLDGIGRIERKMDRGGVGARLAGKAIDGAGVLGGKALDGMIAFAQHPNAKWLALVLIVFAVLSWGATATWGDFTVGPASAAGPSPLPVEGQE